MKRYVKHQQLKPIENQGGGGTFATQMIVPVEAKKPELVTPTAEMKKSLPVSPGKKKINNAAFSLSEDLREKPPDEVFIKIAEKDKDLL